MKALSLSGIVPAVVILLGLAAVPAFSAGPVSSPNAGAYPNYYELMLENLALLQGEDQEEEEVSSEGEEPERVSITPELYTEVASAIVGHAELGLVRPGEINTVPRFAYKFGDFRLFPRYRQEVRYDDNIFLTDTASARRDAGIPNPDQDARKWDVRFEERPGLFVDYPFGGGDHSLHFGYEANFVNFMRRDQAFGFIEQFAGAGVNLRGNNWKFDAGDRYELRYDPVETQFAGVGTGTQPVNQMKRGINTADYRAGLSVGKLEFEQGYVYQNEDYKGPGFITRADRDEQTVTALGGLYTREDFRWFLQYDYVTRRQRESFIGDTFFNRCSLGVNGKLSEQVETRSRVGWRHQLCETGEAVGDDTSRDGGIDVSSDSRFWLDSKTLMLLSYVRTTEFSIVSNFQLVDHGEVAIQHNLQSNVVGRLGYFIERDDPSKRGADSFTSGGAGAGFKYVIEDWIDFDAGYTFRYRISNSPGNDYNNNLVSAAFTLKF